MKENDTTSVVRIYSTRQQAEFGQMLLEGSGILSFIRADDAGGMQPFLAPMTGVRLVVRSEDFDRADDVLKEPEQTSADPEADGSCR